MSLREWLVAIGALVIIVIVVDGLRRMRRARREAMAISSGMGADDIENSPLDDEFNSELPNGGARPVSRSTLEERGYLTSAKPEPEHQPDAASAEPFRRDPDPDLDPDADIDPDPDPNMDLDPDLEPDYSSPPSSRPGHPESDEPAFGPAYDQADDESAEPVSASEDIPEAHEQIIGESRGARPSPKPERSFEQKVERKVERKAERRSIFRKTEPPTVTEVEENTASRGRVPQASPDHPKAGANRPPAEEVVVINVLARDEAEFSGAALKKLFDACGLEHGDLDIYHRHETTDPTSPVQFSVASAVEPGTFLPDTMNQMSTPGISFFMSLPGPSNSMQAFDFMLETAQTVVRNLGGELKDERRSVMTAQTIEHCRQRIREYERKRRSRR